MLNSRYDHKKALAMWLHHKEIDQIPHLIKERKGEREGASPGSPKHDPLPAEESPPSPPAPPPRKKPRRRQLPDQGKKEKSVSAYTRQGKPDSLTSPISPDTPTTGSSDARALASLGNTMKSMSESSAKSSALLEKLLQESCSQMSSLTKSVAHLSESLDKLTKKVSGMEGSLKELAKEVGREGLLPKEHVTRSHGLPQPSVAEDKESGARNEGGLKQKKGKERKPTGDSALSSSRDRGTDQGFELPEGRGK